MNKSRIEHDAATPLEVLRELQAEARPGRDCGRQRKPRQIRKFRVLLRNLKSGEIESRGPFDAKDENTALMRAFARKPTRTKGGGYDPNVELQKLRFEIGVGLKKDQNAQYQLVNVERAND